MTVSLCLMILWVVCEACLAKGRSTISLTFKSHVAFSFGIHVILLALVLPRNENE